MMQGISQDGNLAIEAIFHGRKRERNGARVFRANRSSRPRQKLRRLLRLHPRAAKIPPASNIERNLQPQPVSFLERMNIKRRPVRTAELGASRHIVVAVLVRPIRIDQEHAAIALLLHLLQVPRDGRFIGVPIQPPPITAQSSRGWRIRESLS